MNFPIEDAPLAPMPETAVAPAPVAAPRDESAALRAAIEENAKPSWDKAWSTVKGAVSDVVAGANQPDPEPERLRAAIAQAEAGKANLRRILAVKERTVADLAGDKSFNPEDFYLQHKDGLSPELVHHLAEVREAKDEQPLTAGDVWDAAKGAPGAVWDMGKGVWVALTKDLGATPSEAYAAAAADTAAGLEKSTTGLGNLVSSGLDKLADLPRRMKNAAPGWDTGVQSPMLHSVTPGPDKGPVSKYANPTERLTAFLTKAESKRQLEQIGQGRGQFAKLVGLDADTMAKDGIVVDPEVVSGLATLTDPTLVLPALAGLRAVKIGSKVAVLNDAGKVFATAETQAGADMVKSALEQASATMNAAIAKTANKAATSAQDLTKAAVQKVAGVVEKGAAKGAEALEKTKTWTRGLAGGAAIVQPHLISGIIAGYAGKVALKYGLTGVAEAAKVIGSETVSGAAGIAARKAVETSITAAKGAGHGAVFSIPFAAALEDPQEQAAMLATGSALGGTIAGVVGSVRAVPDAVTRVAEIAASEHLSPKGQLAPTTPTVLEVPGMESLEAGHAALRRRVAKRNPQEAYRGDIQRAALDAKGLPAYYVTPEQMARLVPGGAGKLGVDSAVVNGKPVQLWVVKDGVVEAQVHEPGHFWFDQATPEEQAALKSAFSPEQVEAYRKSLIETRDYTDEQKAKIDTNFALNEMAAEALGHVAEGNGLAGIPPGTREKFVAAVSKLTNRLVEPGIREGTGRAEGRYSRTGVGQTHNPNAIAKGILTRAMSDPEVRAAMEAEQPTPPRPGADPSAPAAAPVAPEPVDPLGAAYDALKEGSYEKGVADALIAKAAKGPLTPRDVANWEQIFPGIKPPGADPVNPAKPVEVPPVKPVSKPAEPVEVKPVAAPSPEGKPVPVEPPNVRGKSTTDYQPFTGKSREPAQQRVNEGAKTVAGDSKLSPEVKQANETLFGNTGRTVRIVYDSAAETGSKSAESYKQRREEVEAARSNPDLRAAATKLGVIPLDFANGAHIVWSGDAALVNIDRVIKQAAGSGNERLIPYPMEGGKLADGGAKLAQDLVDYTRNQNNGYKGDGGELKRPQNPQGFIPDVNPDYTPVPLSAEVANFANLLMGEAPPITARKPQAGTTPVPIRAKAIADANARKGEFTGLSYEAPPEIKGVGIYDFNPLRGEMTAAGMNIRDLNPVHERLSPARIKSAEPMAGVEFQPTAADVTAAGFMADKLPGDRAAYEDLVAKLKEMPLTEKFGPAGTALRKQIEEVKNRNDGFAPEGATGVGAAQAKINQAAPPEPVPARVEAGFLPPEEMRVDNTALALPVEGVDSPVRYAGEDAGLKPMRFMADKVPGDEHTKPSPSYPDADERAKKSGGNLWVRQTADKDNSNRVLLVQFTPDLMYPNGPDPVSTPYYEKLYSGKRPGYSKAQDFWELPQWAAVATHNLGEKADFYAVRSMDEAKAFLDKADYGRVAFSVMDVSKKVTEELVPHIKGEVDLGGYTDRAGAKELSPRAHIWNSMNEYIESLGLKYDKGFDYRHFRGTEIIPRLELSAGCRHRCTFCTIDRKVTNSPVEEINAQIDAFSDLNAKLVYLNDKTFGQSPNVAEMPRLYKEMKAANPDFDGFIVQTTAAQMKLFTDEYLKASGIRYIELGVETYNDPILKTLRKPATEKLIDEGVEKMRRLGINFIPNIVIGFPGETAESYGRTMDWLKKNEDLISHVNTYNLAVYEGTEMSTKVKAKTAADADENSPNKSFYEDPKIHEDFAKAIYEFGSKQLDKPPVKTQFMAARTEAGKAIEKKGYHFEDGVGPRGLQIVKLFDARNGGGLGYIAYRVKNDTAHLQYVTVAPDLRGQGLGEALYREMATRLQAQGVTKLTGDIIAPEPSGIREKLFGPPTIRRAPIRDLSTSEIVRNSPPSALRDALLRTPEANDDNNVLRTTSRIDPDAQFMAAKTDAGKALEEDGKKLSESKDPATGQTVLQLHDEDGKVESSLSYYVPEGGNVAMVSMVATGENSRNRGLGETLYRELGARLQEQGITELKGITVSEAPIRLRKKVFGNVEVRPFKSASGDKFVDGSPLRDVTSTVDPDVQFMAKKGRPGDHDFDPKDDYTLARLRPSDKRILDFAKSEVAGDLTRDFPAISGFDVYPVKAGSLGGSVAKYADGTSSRPAILIDVSKHLQDTDMATLDALVSSIRHELAHAVEDASGVPYNEKNAEAKGRAFMAKRKPEELTEAQRQFLIAAGLEEAPERVEPVKVRAKRAPKSSNVRRTGWVLPDGEYKPLEGEYHEEDLTRYAKPWREQFGLKPTKNSDIRIDALNKGFVRVRTRPNGDTSMEVNERYWGKQKTAILKRALDSADGMNSLQVQLLDDAGNLRQGDSVEVFRSPDPEQSIRDLISEFKLPGERGASTGPTAIQRARAMMAGGGEARFMAAEKTDRDLSDITKKIKARMKEGGWYPREGFVETSKLSHRTPSEWDVNCGWCEDWAISAQEKYGGSVEWLNETDEGAAAHAVLALDGKYYDSQHPAGVRSVEDLDLVRGVSRKAFMNRKRAEWPHQFMASLKEEPKNPKAVKAAAIQTRDDQIFEGPFHFAAVDEAVKAGALKKDFNPSNYVEGFTTNGGEFLTREEAYDRAIQLRQIKPQDAVDDGMAYDETGGSGMLESNGFNDYRKFMAAKLPPRPPIVDQLELGKPLPPVDRYSRAYTNQLTREQLRTHWPEAILEKEGPISSDLVGSPIVRKHGLEKAATIVGDKLVERYNAVADKPETQLGATWYSRFAPALKKFFGDDTQLFAEFLASTSPNTNPQQNFRMATEAYRLYKAGWYDNLVAGFNEGLDRLSDGSLFADYEDAVPASQRPANISDATLMKWWVESQNLKPTKAPRLNGKTLDIEDQTLFGMSSAAVLKVAARKWMEKNAGPKTTQFVKNLTGADDGATIDVWADRTLRQAAYEGAKQRWRILPENSAPVNDADFAFGQAAFNHAAKKLGIKPSALQGALWFAEKAAWAEKGWSPLNLGDFMPHLEEIAKPGLKAEDLYKDLPKSKDEARVNVEIRRKQAVDAAKEAKKAQKKLEVEIRKAEKLQKTLF